MKAAKEKIMIPRNRRVICISDIHGNLTLFERLLNKVAYTKEDTLILLGDLYTKGKQNHETLQSIIALSREPNVHILRGNCDWIEDYLSDAEKVWLDSLPHIIESQDYVFVHGGLTSDNLDDQDAATCMKNDAFMEQGLTFDRYVITGHWPTANYTHGIPSCNPIIDEEKRIICVDGGLVIKEAGQLNAFMIRDGAYSFESVDDLPIIHVEKAQEASGGYLNITWNDRYVELLEEGEEFSLYRHVLSGKSILLPKAGVWDDGEGHLCECDNGTDYYLPVDTGEAVSLVGAFGGKILAKKNGIVGWIDA